MKTKIIALIGLVAVAATLYVLNERRLAKAEVSDFERSFAVFDEYLAAAKAHDLEKLSALSYQLSETCKDESKRKDCEALMDNVAYFGTAFSRENMKVFGRDRKQIILAGEFQEILEGDVPSITRPIIYFVREDDAVKLLSFNPFQGAFFFRGDAATSTVSERLWASIADSDNDSLPDKTENCEDNESGPDCVKTNPSKKDSDGDGWWDSIEALFYPSRDEALEGAEE